MARKKSFNPIVKAVVPFLAANYVRLVHAVLRWEIRGQAHHDKLIGSGQPFICVFWHSRLLMMPMLYAQQKRPLAMLISEHRDGELIARTIGQFGIDTRRGSAADPRKTFKNKRGAAALKSMVSFLRAGGNAGITPDGPRGPRQRAHRGVAQLARLSGLPVLPISYSMKRGKFAKSWDRFLIPLPIPFSKACLVYGEPIYATGKSKDDLEATRLLIENSLNRITEEADLAMGHQPVHAAQTVNAPEAEELARPASSTEPKAPPA